MPNVAAWRWAGSVRRRRGGCAKVLWAVAAISAGALDARAAAPGSACPAPAPSVFSENGAEELLASRAESSQPLRILAIGSSSTLGIGASAPTNAYPAQLAKDLSTQWGIATQVRNAGVAGEVSSATLARLRAELSSDPPELVIWQVGTNDAVAGVDADEFRANLEDGVEAARVQRVPIILVDPQFYFGIKNLMRFEQFVAIVGDVGAGMRVPVFSRFAMMKAWGAKSVATLRATLAPDGFHMDDQGYACFASALADDIAHEDLRAGKSSAAKM
ncbi:MAG: SGNH/GDSL hydrolase family protein [Roseiarcus sp.]